MDENLPRLVRELRQETCPQRVFDEIARRIAAQASRRRRFRYGIPATATILVLLCGLAVWRGPQRGNNERQAKLAEQAALDRRQIARQTEGALGLLGSILLDAGAHSETVIFNRAVPPLRNGLETAKNKIIHPIEP
jgi:hypothetical protein